MCIFVCINAYTHTHTHITGRRIVISAHLFAGTSTRQQIGVIYTYVDIFTNIYIKYIYISTYVYICIYTYIHTHTHT